MILEELQNILHKVLVSQICLGDEIHDASKCGEDLTYRRRKAQFWERVEETLRGTIAEMERHIEWLGEEGTAKEEEPGEGGE